MNTGLISPFLNSNHWTASFRGKASPELFKTAAAVTSFGIMVLSSSYIAYTQTSRWIALTATVSIIHLYSLPKILHYANAKMIQIALIINLASLGGIFLGGAASALFSMSTSTITAMKAHQFSTVLFTLFGTTSLLGFGIPLIQEALEKAYRFSFQSETWKDNFVNLAQQFHHMPEMGLGWTQTNLWQNFILQLSLLKPDFVLFFWEFLSVSNRDYVLSMAAAMNERISPDQFRDILSDMLDAALNYETLGEDLPDDVKADYQNQIRLAIRGLNKSDLKTCIGYLLTAGANLIPTVLTNDQFLELFANNDILDSTNELLNEFLDLAAKWTDWSLKFKNLEIEGSNLKKEIDDFEKNQPSLKKDEASLQLEKLAQSREDIVGRLDSFRKFLDKLYSYKRMWKNFAPLWKSSNSLPFKNASQMLQLLNDNALMQEIDRVYRSTHQQGSAGNTSLFDCIQLISNKLNLLNNVEEEELVSSVMYLAANEGFIQKDFETIQEWLNIDSPHDLEDTLASIGLESEEDLYLQNIIVKQGNQQKEEILEKLKDYIDIRMQSKKSQNITPLKQGDHTGPLLQAQKILRILYYAISKGSILVPMLIHPSSGAAGFAIGTVVFTLKRFGVQKAIEFVDQSNEFIPAIPLGKFFRAVIERKVFAIHPREREAANNFADSNFYERMKTITVHLLLTIMISSKFGSFLKGVALSHEIVHLV